MAEKDNIRCSFCNREKRETNVLIAGISGHICDQCINQAQNIVKEESTSKVQLCSFFKVAPLEANRNQETS